MNTDEFRTRAKEAIDQIADYHESVPSRPVVSAVEPNYLAPLLPTSAPLDPEPWYDITADIQSKIMPGITHWSSPGFMAFFCCTKLEVIVMDWLAKLIGLPECFLSKGPTNGGGVIHGSASEAILTVMVGARDKFLAAKTAHLSDDDPDDPDAKEDELWRLRSRLVVLGSAGTHSNTKKAAQILGVRFIAVPVDEEKGFAMQASDLAHVLDGLASRGLEPFFITATLGTIEVCAVDGFPGVVNVLTPRMNTPNEIWVHVDAAYAGSALVLDEYKAIAAPFENFHSFNFNPQKWLLTTFDCSALWVRNRSHLIKSSLSVKPPYLHDQLSDDDRTVDYRDWQIPLARRFRSLKLWFVRRAYGVRGLQAHVRQGILLGKSLEAKLRSRPDLFSIMTPSHFGLLTLRLCAGGNEQLNNSRTEALCERVNSGGQFFLTGTTFNSRFAIRVCTSGASASEEHIKKLFDLFVGEAESIMKEGELLQQL
ncbi:Hypothetical protein NCS54_01379200 [Fusarium falciforme]|uniref:Hypothetical protein n=1 Tax=Fusarium falciforme TaxID=195108 RepID=UPI0023002E5B|nr:Hypothetical protein NCS54_01379200 [Fusarium falciforme]WAO96130.1 Hypothetical protein NCS54_01379200 [Fusarium falciforme]